MKKTIKNNKLNIILFLISIALILIGASLALFNTNLLGIKEHETSFGKDIVFTYHESSNGILLTNDAIASDNDGKNQIIYFDFEVSLQTTLDTTVNYVIYLTKDTAYSNINNNYIKLYLTDQSNTLIKDMVRLSDLQRHYFGNDNYDLYNTSINSNNNIATTHYYRIRMWVSDDFNLESFTTTHNDGSHVVTLDEYKYKFKINVETTTTLDTSGANKPELVTGMIPVYYDSINDTWRKADSSNINATY